MHGNIRVSKHIKQILTSEVEIDNNTIIIENINTPHSTIDRPPRHKINKEMDLNCT